MTLKHGLMKMEPYNSTEESTAELKLGVKSLPSYYPNRKLTANTKDFQKCDAQGSNNTPASKQGDLHIDFSHLEGYFWKAQSRAAQKNGMGSSREAAEML